MPPTWLPLGGLGVFVAYQGLPSCPLCLFFPSRVLGLGRCEQKEIAGSRWEERRPRASVSSQQEGQPTPSCARKPQLKKTLSSLELKLVCSLLRLGLAHPPPVSCLLDMLS